MAKGGTGSKHLFPLPDARAGRRSLVVIRSIITTVIKVNFHKSDYIIF